MNKFLNLSLLAIAAPILALIMVVFAAPTLQPAYGAPVAVVSDENKASACEGITGVAADCGDPGFFSGIIGTIVSVLTFIIGGISVIMLVIGGIRYTVSGGDPNGVKGAKDTILYALVGLVVAASAYLLVRFVIGKL